MIARLLLIAGLVALAGCGRGGSDPPIATVEFIVPTGFTGPVWVLTDPSAPDIPNSNGTYRVNVPKGGLLRAKSIQPLQERHKPKASYDDGTPLPLGDEADLGQVAFRDGNPGILERGGLDFPYALYFVGTDEQFAKFLAGDSKPKVK